ncbi:hypothetical protein GE061_004513 [Apolygus lucorum]|uniref:Centriolar coiled-coil protein of 110 kDa n=1 Tax=Apolygus lucorum TaxID=248454 RepID=A0A6A4IZL6_APOLU|nr:hypothetical protein GE061_004513 [Apolygus lucorum]
MTAPYKSIIKINGQPILPPVVTDCQRPLLRRYKEEAVKIEAEIAERARRLEEERAVQEAATRIEAEIEERVRRSKEERALQEEAMQIEAARAMQSRDELARREALLHNSDRLDDSIVSNMDTAQVMNFIEHALRDSSHNEEVQNLKMAIFNELLKYGGTSPEMRRVDSMDTLHNIEDFSNAAESSREVSPTKSFHSERSLPKTDLDVSSRSNKTSSPRLERSPGSAVDLVGPRMSLSYPSASLMETGYVPSVPGASPEVQSETPLLIRRNSYTLESPSPSVLQYLKSLQIDEEMSADKKAKRNLNQLWSEVLSSSSTDTNVVPMDTNVTPENHSAASWKSEIGPPSVDNTSIVMNKIVESKSNHVLFDQDQLNSNISPKATNICTKKNYKENNNNLSNIEKAAAKIQAGVRGYLTRRLLKTAKVVELKNAIRDSLVTALQMHSEITVSKAELELHRQLTLQIESLCDEWHQIFFELTPQERMRIIQVDRTKAKNPKPKKPFLMRKSRSRVSMSTSATSLTSSTSSIAARPKSLPLMKPAHASSASNFKAWK